MRKYRIILFAFLMYSCVEDINHDVVSIDITSPNLLSKTNITYQQLFNLHSNAIGKDTLITGYVVSSDVKGNFFKELYVQNTPVDQDIADDDPRMGVRLRVGLRSVHTKYALGRKVAINLEGLKRTTTDDLITIGVPDGNFIRDITEFKVEDHILKYDEIAELEPKVVSIADLGTNDLNTLVKIGNLHFDKDELGIQLAGLSTDDFDGKRTLEFCSAFSRDTIVLETSNFSDFAEQVIPSTQINVTAIYNINFDDEPALVLNDFEDLEQDGAYVECNVTTPNILITEIADPKNASFSRYVELYNAELESINLNGWTLTRHINGNTESIVSLDGLTIETHNFLVIANEEVSTESNLNFLDAFGFEADLVDSKIDGNGDDGYSLKNSEGTLIDVYGEIDKDGTDLGWDYEDGRAYRIIDVIEPNNIFTLSEWGVLKDNQNAPDDFSPNERLVNEVEIKVVVDEVETASLMITEVADPDENTSARFVEIYNPTSQEVSLEEWTLVRYNYTSNNNTKVLAAKPIILDDLVIPSKGFVMVTKELTAFNTYFGINADVESSNLDGNGDDAYELIDPFDTVIDIYGDPNTDGSGFDWEYTDSVAKRLNSITSPNTSFDISEWEIKEDQVGAGSYSSRVR